jgi:hypothetical protein
MQNLSPAISEVEAMARHEEAISELYAAFADKFPDYKDFWTELANEETGHAEWIRKFKAKCEGGDCKVNEGRFRVKAIDTSIQYINGYIHKAQTEDMVITYALTISQDIENALIDKNFIEVYDTDDEELKKTLQFLIDDTKRHKAKVEKLLSQTRHSGELGG